MSMEVSTIIQMLLVVFLIASAIWGIGYKKSVYCSYRLYGVQLHYGDYLGIFTVT